MARAGCYQVPEGQAADAQDDRHHRGHRHAQLAGRDGPEPLPGVEAVLLDVPDVVQQVDRGADQAEGDEGERHAAQHLGPEQPSGGQRSQDDEEVLHPLAWAERSDRGGQPAHRALEGLRHRLRGYPPPRQAGCGAWRRGMAGGRRGVRPAVSAENERLLRLRLGAMAQGGWSSWSPSRGGHRLPGRVQRGTQRSDPQRSEPDRCSGELAPSPTPSPTSGSPSPRRRPHHRPQRPTPRPAWPYAASARLRERPIGRVLVAERWVVSTAVDQPNVVTIVLAGPSPQTVEDYLRATLPNEGFTIDARADAGEAMTFEGNGWTGGVHRHRRDLGDRAPRRSDSGGSTFRRTQRRSSSPRGRPAAGGAAAG